MREIGLFIVALLGKWKWRLKTKGKWLWGDVPKYGYWRSLATNNKSRMKSSWWKDLRKVVVKIMKIISLTIILSRGRGNLIIFWEDSWITTWPFKEKYLRIYADSIAKESIIGEMGQWENCV